MWYSLFEPYLKLSNELILAPSYIFRTIRAPDSVMPYTFNMDTSTSAPHFGSRLLVSIVDSYAASPHDKDRLYASIPKSSNLQDGFADVTFALLAQAVDYLAWRIHHTLGASSTFDTISYVGPADIRYAFVFLASIKCGYKVKQQIDIFYPI